jgi:uncharacterized protein (DUF433 family)
LAKPSENVRFEIMNLPQFERISINPAIMGGKPCLGQTRVTVGTITGLVASEVSFDEILRLYPCLTRDDIHAALLYAAWRAEEQEIELHAV